MSGSPSICMHCAIGEGRQGLFSLHHFGAQEVKGECVGTIVGLPYCAEGCVKCMLVCACVPSVVCLLHGNMLGGVFIL